MPLVLRPARPEDAEQIADFNIRLAAESEGVALDPQVVGAGVRRLLADPSRGRYLLATVGDRVVGQLAVTLEWSDWRDGWYWWIQSVFVHEEARSEGVFRALFHEVVRQARAAGDVAEVRLYVEEHNVRAQEVYRRLGMKRTGYLVLSLEAR